MSDQDIKKRAKGETMKTLTEVVFLRVKECTECHTLYESKEGAEVLIDAIAISGELWKTDKCVVCGAEVFSDEIHNTHIARPYKGYAQTWTKLCYHYVDMESMLSQIYGLKLIGQEDE